MLKFLKGLLILIAIGAALALIFIIFQVQILTFVGNYLIKEDVLQNVDAAVVLSGSPEERLSYAQQVLEEGYTPTLITTGANVDPDLKLMGFNLPDAIIAKRSLLQNGVDTAAVQVLAKGSSTFEESEEILGYSQSKGYKKLMLITSKFHTRRVNSVFRDKYRDAGIEIIIRGAEPLDYQIETWWSSEISLIFVNNEYVKLIYYWFKY